MPRRPLYVLVAMIVIAGTCLYFIVLRPARPATKQSSQPSETSQSSSKIEASYNPPLANGLITNEFAYWNKGNPSAKTTPDWQMSSGSLFARRGVFWTGNTDSCSNSPRGPNATSSNCTDSNVFRLNTVKTFAGNLAISIAVKQNVNIHDASCNEHNFCWNGTHVWLRYLSQYNLYYASVNRADGQVVIKRKVPCGPSDSGTYFVLGSYVRHDFATGVWNHYTVTVQTNADQSVTIKLFDDSLSSTRPIVSGTDHGGINPNWSPKCTVAGHYASANYPPITAPGSIGIRGDFANFEFKQFQVTSL